MFFCCEIRLQLSKLFNNCFSKKKNKKNVDTVDFIYDSLKYLDIYIDCLNLKTNTN